MSEVKIGDYIIKIDDNDLWRIIKYQKEAAIAYNQAAIKYYGQYARLNPINHCPDCHGTGEKPDPFTQSYESGELGGSL